MTTNEPEISFYDRIGGEAAFHRMVAKFYEGVAEDAELRALYPEEDLGPAEDRLRLFLEQYWGGPKTYGEQRGHPRLRMRHAPYAVTPTMRDKWLTHMRAGVDELELEPTERDQLWAYLENAAFGLVNSYDDLGSPESRS